MDSTTTVTQHWQLEKYSRSRSSPADRLEWDHYTQPRLQLSLHTTYAGLAHTHTHTHAVPVPSKMLFQVAYDPLYSDAAADPDRPPLLLDSIDLASFSSYAVQRATPTDQLPLKAVYRDAVLGLRYLAQTPPAAAAPHFRRVQAKFTSTKERQRFVDAIKLLVPVKPAAEPSAAAQQQQQQPSKRKPAAGDQVLPFATPQSQPSGSAATRRPTKKSRHNPASTSTSTPTMTSSHLGDGTNLLLLQQHGTFFPPPPLPLQQQQQYHVPYDAPASSHVSSSTGHHQKNLLPPAGGLLATLLPRLCGAAVTNTTSVIAANRTGAAAATAGVPGPSSTSYSTLLPPPPLQQQQLPAMTTTSDRTVPFHSTTTDNANASASSNQSQSKSKNASLALLELGPDELETLLTDALLEPGFDRLVHRIRDTLVGDAAAG